MAGYKTRLKRSWKFIVAILAPIILLPVVFINDDDLIPAEYYKVGLAAADVPVDSGEDISYEQSPKFKLAYVILLMAVYWAFEILPLPITSLFPLVLFPLWGIDNAGDVSKSYMKESNTIFLGGAIVALAVEYCNLHRRVALRLITIVGVSPKRLLFGIMTVVSFLAMWISNVTCVTMLVPIIVAIVDEIHEVSDATIADYTIGQDRGPNNNSNNAMPQSHGQSQPGVYSPSMRHSSVFANRGLSSRRSQHGHDAPKNNDNERSTLGTLEGHRSNRDSARSHNHPIIIEENNNNSKIKPESPSEKHQPGMQDVNGNFTRSDSMRASIISSRVVEGQLETIVELSSPTPSECEDEAQRKQAIEREKWRRIKNMYLFALAYAANIGGTATITGTGPNKVFKEAIKPYSKDISQGGKYLGMTFFTWMAFNVPPMIVNVLVAWLYLVIKYVGVPKLKLSRKPEDEAEHAFERWKEQNVRHYIVEEYKKLGKMTFHEIGVALVFLLVVFLWILRDPQLFPGWNDLTSHGMSGDSTAALLGAVLLFIIPRSWSFLSSKDGVTLEALLDWKFVTQKLPWGVLLLLGSGYAIGDSADRTGLSSWIGKELYLLHSLPEPLLLLIVMFITTFITEVVSNTAAASIILPVLLGLSREMGIHPLYLSVGASVTASYAFMLPVASPVNAIVFAAGDFSIWEMIANGYILNGICLLVFYINTMTLGEFLFNYSDFTYPLLPSSTTVASVDMGFGGWNSTSTSL